MSEECLKHHFLTLSQKDRKEIEEKIQSLKKAKSRMLRLLDCDNKSESNASYTCPNTYRGAEKSEQDLYPGCSLDWLPGCTLDSHLAEEYDCFGLI